MILVFDFGFEFNVYFLLFVLFCFVCFVVSNFGLDMQFVKTLLMTYQSFSTPEMLLTKLIQRFHVPKNFKVPNSTYYIIEKCHYFTLFKNIPPFFISPLFLFLSFYRSPSPALYRNPSKSIIHNNNINNNNINNWNKGDR